MNEIKSMENTSLDHLENQLEASRGILSQMKVSNLEKVQSFTPLIGFNCLTSRSYLFNFAPCQDISSKQIP